MTIFHRERVQAGVVEGQWWHRLAMTAASSATSARASASYTRGNAAFVSSGRRRMVASCSLATDGRQVFASTLAPLWPVGHCNFDNSHHLLSRGSVLSLQGDPLDNDGIEAG
jgi:hypothetical protein